MNVRRDPAMAPARVETERLILRPFEAADARELRDVLNYESVSRATDDQEIPHPFSEEHAAAFIAETIDAARRGERLILAGVVQQTGIMIAEVGLWDIDWRHRRADLGIIIRPDHWGHGYGSEALRAVLEVGFAGLNLRRLDGGCFSWNAASERMMRNCGLVEEGRRRSYFRQGDVWEDETLFGILQSAWHDAGRRVIRNCDPPLHSIAKEPTS